MARFFLSLLLLSMLGMVQVSFAQDCGVYPAKQITPLTAGGRVDWSKSYHGLIAYDRLPEPGEGREEFFQVYVRSLDGTTTDYCLTCDVSRRNRELRKHKGNPAWHPSGEYIVFQAQTAAGDAPRKFANPGRGVDNVLWLANKEGTKFWRLADPDPALGVLHPHFSPDGRWLVWSEMYAPGEPEIEGQAYGYWQLKSAELKLDEGRPHLDFANARTYRTEVEGFYENHGFSPDGSRLLFSGNIARTGIADRLNNDIFSLELPPPDVNPLELPPGTLPRQHTTQRYNEHAHYTARGDKILWVTNRGNLNRGTDLWIMPADGTAEEDGQRVTAFNQRSCPESADNRVVAADSSVNAEGDKVLLYAQDEILVDVGSILLIEVPSPF